MSIGWLFTVGSCETEAGRLGDAEILVTVGGDNAFEVDPFGVDVDSRWVVGAQLGVFDGGGILVEAVEELGSGKADDPVANLGVILAVAVAFVDSASASAEGLVAFG